MRKKKTKSIICLILLVIVVAIVSTTIVKLATLGYNIHITVEKQKIEVSSNQTITNSNT